MRTITLAHRFILAGLAAIGAAVLLWFAASGGSQAQTPTATTPTVANPAATLTAAAGQQILQQQQVASATPFMSPTPVGTANIAATATWIAILTQQQQGVATATPVTTMTPIASVTPVTLAPGGQATTTAPSAATAADACAMQLASARGGQTIDFEQISLTLPSSGNFTYGFIRPETGANPQLVVCDVQSRSTIYVDGRTGRETARRLGDTTGSSTLSQIVAGARAGTSSSGGGVFPPNTGDGGLR